MVYLYHFEKAYFHAQHYLGSTNRNLSDRHQEHISGRGSPLVHAAHKAGIDLTLIPLYIDEGFALERAIKRYHNNRRICPICNRKELPS